ncbi:hypothetical protein [Shewanella sp. YLB-07]|uniref:hypothetical protein n=1 Tax=Shewanella sp. YLB-07 TaxID=2601268 RepID=UPI00128B72F9|nr:hypothetical protein [Shewanella sp. YLB-07]MPY24408.1 hypothetical protein [Shewanella sp. YLB-07]
MSQVHIEACFALSIVELSSVVKSYMGERGALIAVVLVTHGSMSLLSETLVNGFFDARVISEEGHFLKKDTRSQSNLGALRSGSLASWCC